MTSTATQGTSTRLADATAQAQPSPALGGVLEALEHAPRYRDWIFAAAAPHLGNRVLEVGAGTGTLTACVTGRERVLAVEAEPGYADSLRRRFALHPNVEVLEASATDGERLTQAVGGRIDSAMTFNVLEHIPDDRAVLEAIHDALPSGGRLACFVPAFPSLFGSMDRALGHVRRYTKRELCAKMQAAGLSIVEARYMNLLGYFLWFVNGRILQSSGVAGGTLSIRVHDRLILPATRVLERRWRPPFGQSLLVVGERQD